MMKLGNTSLPTLTPDDKKHLPWYDYSTLTAVNTCPRWGLIHSVHGKRFESSARRMPLEAGKAMHDMFAAVRMFELFEENKSGLVRAHGERLFGEERWDDFVRIANEQDDYDTRMMRCGLHILETTGFHDDPNDRRRTQTNLETAAIAYISSYPKRRFIPVVREDIGFVGVEMHLDLLISSGTHQGAAEFRFVGKTDAVCHDMLANGKVEVHENKTGSRIDTVWIDGFATNHQPTGYCVGASVLLGEGVWTTQMWGTQLPVPKQSMFTNGQARMPVERDEHQLIEWYRWLWHTVDMIAAHEDKPTDAPMYTHSCSRYFSSCSFIPLCACGPDERKHIYDNEMVIERWSPLEDN